MRTVVCLMCFALVLGCKHTTKLAGNTAKPNPMFTIQ